MSRLEANCDEMINELFDTKIKTSIELACAVAYTCGRIEERGRTVPYWHEEYGHDLLCRLLALHQADELTVCTIVHPVFRDIMLSFLLDEKKYPAEKVMKKFNKLRQQL